MKSTPGIVTAVALTAALVVAALSVGGCRNGRGAGEGRAPATTAPRPAAGGEAPDRGAPGAGASQQAGAADAPGHGLTLHPSGGPAVALRVELAVTARDRARGLMYRERLASDRGMLFVFPTEGDYPFYMRNTYIPLDLVYIDAAGRVVGVIEDMRPMDETPRSVGRPAKYVLEVNAGSVDRWGLRVGDRVTLPDV